MDVQTKEIPQVPRQRRKKTKLQIFKEAYLPLVIILLTIVMVIIFIVGSITRASQRRKEELAASLTLVISLCTFVKMISFYLCMLFKFSVVIKILE